MSTEYLGPGKRTEARRLKLVAEGDRMTMRPSRFGLALGMGALAGLVLFIYGLASVMAPKHARPVAPRPRPISAPTVLGQPVPLTPLVPITRSRDRSIDRTRDPAEDEPPLLRIVKAPWLPVPFGFCVFWVVSLLFHDHIILDRGLNVLMRGQRVICKLSDVTKVELEDYFRVRVMNELALVLSDGREFSLLLFDRRADEGLKAAAKQIAEFAGVPLEVKTGGSYLRGKKT